MAMNSDVVIEAPFPVACSSPGPAPELDGSFNPDRRERVPHLPAESRQVATLATKILNPLLALIA